MRSPKKRNVTVNWEDCALIERVPGRMGGRPTIKGTRIEPKTIVEDFELGSTVEEIHENFPSVDIATIRGVIAFAHEHPLVA